MERKRPEEEEEKEARKRRSCRHQNLVRVASWHNILRWIKLPILQGDN
jgi:hypothetical protein